MEKLFTTSDLALCTSLVALKFNLGKVLKEMNGKVIFSFQNNPTLQKAILAFWSKELRLEPQELLMTFKMLKNRIYSL